MSVFCTSITGITYLCELNLLDEVEIGIIHLPRHNDDDDGGFLRRLELKSGLGIVVCRLALWRRRDHHQVEEVALGMTDLLEVSPASGVADSRYLEFEVVKVEFSCASFDELLRREASSCNDLTSRGVRSYVYGVCKILGSDTTSDGTAG